MCYKQNFAAYYEPKLLERYNGAACHSGDKTCICMVDGTDFNPGLCDKLRGILSIFYLCRKYKVNFKISWVFPFDLTDYLLPNEYDWTIDSKDICYSGDTCPVVIDYATYLVCQEQIDKLTFRKRICDTRYSQYHVYSNTIVGKGRFTENFNKLFKPSKVLAGALDEYRSKLGANYISFSLRFMELLGDFKDQEGVSAPLPETEQAILIERCANKVLEVLNKQPQGPKAFVASDSRKFLEYIIKKDSRIYIVPGDIVHIRYKGSDSAYLKTFVDLFLLKDARTRYLIKTGAMYNSGFPRFASWIGNGDFRLIEF